MNTKIKVTVYAAKLRAKLKELESKRVKDLAQHKKDFSSWRASLTIWITRNAAHRVMDISVQEVKDNQGYSRDDVYFDGKKFFTGCPKAPVYPSDKRIRDIKNILRHLGITGQATINVSTEEVARFLGDSERFEE